MGQTMKVTAVRKRRNGRYAALATAFCLLTMATSAQTVRPLIAELGNPAKGRVEYVNESALPLNVVIETKSFSVSEDGELTYRPLDSNIRLKLSATSFRIPPQQTYYLFYEASTAQAPAWFVIYASFSGFGLRTQQGLNVRLQLPHTVYLLPKAGIQKSQVRVTRAEYHPESNKLAIEVENTGPNFGRVQESWLTGRKRTEGPGFPLFPQSRRRMEYACDSTGAPSKIELDFEKFKVEAEVTHP